VADPSKVKAVLGAVGIPSESIRIAPGWFKDTLPNAPIDRVALLHIDCDWYESVKLCLEQFYDRVNSNGIIVLNDYGVWPGAKRAVDEFRDRRGLESVRLRWVDPGTRYFRKP
jgi:hypothetical protein